MEIKKKVKGIFSRKKTVEFKPGLEVPKEWIPRTSKETKAKFEPSKFHIPFLRTFNHGLALIGLIVNFILAQATLATNMQPLFWLFLLNTYIHLRYLWKSRRKEV